MTTEPPGPAAGGSVRTFHARTGRLSSAKRRVLAELLPRLAPAVGERIDALDFGCGTGEALLARARAEPERIWLGVDVHRASLATAARRVTEAATTGGGAGNVRLLLGDGVDIVSRRIDVESLQAVQILFPDPWPKAAHRSRRLVQAAFVDLLASRLRPGGHLELATDDPSYGAQMLAVLGSCPRLRGGPVAALGTAPTFYEQRARAAGRPVLQLRYHAG